MVIPVNKLILEFYTQNNKRSEIVSNEIIWTSRLAPNDYEEEFREKGGENLGTDMQELKYDIKRLERAIERLEGELEALKEFPIVCQNGFILKAVMVDFRPHYDSIWNIIILDDNNKLQEIRITRFDTENMAGITKKLKEVEKIEDIKKLCMKDFIYYD